MRIGIIRDHPALDVNYVEIYICELPEATRNDQRSHINRKKLITINNEKSIELLKSDFDGLCNGNIFTRRRPSSVIWN